MNPTSPVRVAGTLALCLFAGGAAAGLDGLPESATVPVPTSDNESTIVVDDELLWFGPTAAGYSRFELDSSGAWVPTIDVVVPDVGDSLTTASALDMGDLLVGVVEDSMQVGKVLVRQPDGTRQTVSLTSGLRPLAMATNHPVRDVFGTALVVTVGHTVEVLERAASGWESMQSVALEEPGTALIGSEFKASIAFDSLFGLALVGIFDDDSSSTESGRVYVLQRDAGTGFWAVTDRIVRDVQPSSVVSMNFGSAVALLGSTAFIGNDGYVSETDSSVSGAIYQYEIGLEGLADSGVVLYGESVGNPLGNLGGSLSSTPGDTTRPDRLVAIDPYTAVTAGAEESVGTGIVFEPDDNGGFQLKHLLVSQSFTDSGSGDLVGPVASSVDTAFVLGEGSGGERLLHVYDLSEEVGSDIRLSVDENPLTLGPGENGQLIFTLANFSNGAASLQQLFISPAPWTCGSLPTEVRPNESVDISCTALAPVASDLVTLTVLGSDSAGDFAVFQTVQVDSADGNSTSDGELFLSEVDRGVYGFNAPEGAEEFRDEVSFDLVLDDMFSGALLALVNDGSGDFTLTLRGYDVDFDDEIEVLINGVSIGFLAKGRNNQFSLTSDVFVIPADLLNADPNVLTIRQARESGWTWGVTDLYLEPMGPGNRPPLLIIGQTDEIRYGWNWPQADVVTLERASFQLELSIDQPVPALASDVQTLNGAPGLEVSMRGYDVDFDNEVRVSINGIELGFLSKGSDGAESGELDRFMIPTALLPSPDNLLEEQALILTVEQARTSGWTWGVTDLTLEVVFPDEPDILLAIGERDAGSYGFDYPGAEVHRDEVSATYAQQIMILPTLLAEPVVDTAVELELEVRGFDVDFADEVEVLLDGESLGFLSKGTNNAESAQVDVFALPPYGLWPQQQLTRELVNGVRGPVLTFRQARTSGWTWGVTDLLVREAQPPVDETIRLSQGDLEAQLFGNNVPSGLERGAVVRATFPGLTGAELTLAVRGYDVDFADEVEVFLNGNSLGNLAKGRNNARSLTADVFVLPADLLLDGENLLEFVQARDPSWTWGVSDLLVRNPGGSMGADVILNLNLPDDGAYGWNYPGAIPILDFVRAQFSYSGVESVSLTVTGFDVDFADEVEVLLNGNPIGFLPVGPDNGLSEPATFVLPGGSLQSTNLVGFRQARQSGWTWGVTGLLVQGQELPPVDLIADN